MFKSNVGNQDHRITESGVQPHLKKKSPFILETGTKFRHLTFYKTPGQQTACAETNAEKNMPFSKTLCSFWIMWISFFILGSWTKFSGKKCAVLFILLLLYSELLPLNTQSSENSCFMPTLRITIKNEYHWNAYRIMKRILC